MIPCKRPYIKRPDGVSLPYFAVSKKARDSVTPFPCGNCIPCKVNKQREWGFRILLETTSHNDSSFVTLTMEDDKITYDDNMDWHVDKRDAQLFLKSLRHEFKFRYFMVGEYGTDFGRPHYHAMLFGIAPTEKNLKIITEKWKRGFCYIGDCNMTTARYITGYCMKKMTQEGDERLHGKKPEFKISSTGTHTDNMGGLGRQAVREIAASVRRSGAQPRSVVRRIRFGNQMHHLGRYLTWKLNVEDLEMDPEIVSRETLKYQTDIYLKYMKGGYYTANMLDDTKGTSDSIEAKYLITKLRKVLK